MMKSSPPKHVAVLGAGAIGCYIGLAWADVLKTAGCRLTLIGREEVLRFGGGATVKLSGEQNAQVPLADFDVNTSSEVLKSADIVLLAVKATALPDALSELQRNISADTVVISLLNGLEPARQLREHLPDHTVLAGMVPFNVVWGSADILHRSSAGKLALEKHLVTKWLSEHTDKTCAAIDLHNDLQPIQYGKLLLNLINPLNALSGIPLFQMLSQKTYRKIYTEILGEALAVYEAGNIEWQKVGPIPPKLAMKFLSASDFIFNNSLLKLQRLDKTSMTSMASDMQNGKPTEIDSINGEIVRIAERIGHPAPVNSSLVHLIKRAEADGFSPRFSAQEIATKLGL